MILIAKEFQVENERLKQEIIVLKETIGELEREILEKAVEDILEKIKK